MTETKESQHTFTITSTQMIVLSILLGALIVSASILVAFGGKTTGPLVLPDTSSSGSAQAAAPSNPSQQPPQKPSQSPPSGSISLAETMRDAAATKGDPNAPVVIVEYSDYQCPFCKRFFDNTLSQLQAEYIDTGKAYFVYKDFPLQGLHPQAQIAAEAARCAGDQGKYWEYHNQIFSAQASLSESALKQWASDLGLNTEEFNTCLDSGKYTSLVQSNFSDGQVVGVSGTPSFIIGKNGENGSRLVGAQPYATFKSAIDALLG